MRHKITRLLIASFCLNILILSQITRASDNGPLAYNEGWQEVVVVVSDPEKSALDFIEVGQWEVIYKGNSDPALLKALKLPPDTTAHEVLLKNPGTDKGLIRFIKYSGIEQQHIRPGAQTWDTGGIFDIGLRVNDIHAKFNALLSRGWHAYSQPVKFTFGKFTVSEVLMQGPDGLVVAMVERHEPILTDWPHLKHFSHTFNSTFIVKNARESSKFFANTLGFKTYMEVHNDTPPKGENVLGIPQNINSSAKRDVYIMHPTGTNAGSIELLSYDNLEGHDFSNLSKPGNLGLSALRFPVTDLQAKAKELMQKGVNVTISPTIVNIAPYGLVDLFAFKTPSGIWFEYFEPITTNGNQQ